MGLFSIFGNFLDSVFSFLVGLVAGLIATAIAAVGLFIDLAADILDWIGGCLDDLLDEGCTEVNVIMGSPFADYIKEQQAKGNVTEISLSELKTIEKSVINVADNNINVVKTQMITSDKGVSEETVAQFKGNPIMKVKIAQAQ